MPIRRLAICLPILVLAACGEPAGGRPASDATTSSSVASADIVQTAKSAGQFKTLLAALAAADLEDTLRGPGPFTVFAPDDAAFAKLPKGTVESLLDPANKPKLKAILTYHVVAAKVPSAEAVKLKSATTVNGKELALDASSGKLVVGKANVVSADVLASNGVIHVVDAVILPPEL